MPARKSFERTPAVVERVQAISDSPGQSLRVLMNVVKPWIETVVAGRPYVFQQDDTPAHTSHLIQN